MRMRGGLLGASCLVVAVGCATDGTERFAEHIDDVIGSPIDADSESPDDGPSDDEPPAPGDGPDPGPDPADPSEDVGVDPGCEELGCPSDAPYCVESGACEECLGLEDCALATCEAGSCEPLPLDGLVTWLRAEELVPGPLATWPAALGESSASQVDPVRWPTVSSIALAGGPAVVFDGVDDQLVFDDGGALAGAPARTVIAVLQAAGDTGHVVGAATSTSGQSLAIADGRPQWTSGGVPGGGPDQHLLAVPRIITLRSDHSGTTLFVDGDLAAASPLGLVAGTATSTTLGAADGDATGSALQPFEGAISDLLIYDRALIDAERARVENWLAQMRGLSTPDPVETLTADVRIFYGMNEEGPGPRQDVLGNLPLSPYPNTDGIVGVPGVVGAAQHVDGAYGGYHFFRSGAGAALDHSTDSFTWAGWVAIDATDEYDPYELPQTLVGKWDPPSACQVRVWFDPPAGRWSISVSATGEEADAVTVTHPHVVQDGTWVLVEAWRDTARGELGIRVSPPALLGDAVTLPLHATLPVTANDLNVAAHATCSDGYLQGTVDALGQWHRPLTDPESALLLQGFEP